MVWMRFLVSGAEAWLVSWCGDDGAHVYHRPGDVQRVFGRAVL